MAKKRKTTRAVKQPSRTDNRKTVSEIIQAFKKRNPDGDLRFANIVIDSVNGEFGDTEKGIDVSDPGTTKVPPGSRLLWVILNNSENSAKVKLRGFRSQGRSDDPCVNVTNKRQTQVSGNGGTGAVEVSINNNAVVGRKHKYNIYVNKVRAVDPELDIIPVDPPPLG